MYGRIFAKPDIGMLSIRFGAAYFLLQSAALTASTFSVSGAGPIAIVQAADITLSAVGVLLLVLGIYTRTLSLCVLLWLVANHIFGGTLLHDLSEMFFFTGLLCLGPGRYSVH